MLNTVRSAQTSCRKVAALVVAALQMRHR